MSQPPQDAPYPPQPPYGAPASPPEGYPPPSSPYGAPYGQAPYGQAPYGSPYGQAPYGQAPYGSPYGAPVPHPTAYADWGSRVGAALIDSLVSVPAFVLVVVGFSLLGSSDQGGGSTGAAAPVGVLLAVLGYVAAFALQVWNRVVRQGRTGQSWGKKVLGITLLAEQTGRPVGAGLAFGRELCHVLDGFFYLGYLWPLWDHKRQTFADKVCSTVVVRTPPAPR